MDKWIEYEDGFFMNGDWCITPPFTDTNDTDKWQLYHEGDVWDCDSFNQCNAIYLNWITPNKYKHYALFYRFFNPQKNFYSLSSHEAREFMRAVDDKNFIWCHM